MSSPTEPCSRFAELYKNNLRSETFQIERRHQILELQKNKRNEEVDKHRQVLKNLRDFQSNNKYYYQKRTSYKSVFQLSEWMDEKPDDIENWYLVPCPRGTRVLLVADGGRTEVITKTGVLLFTCKTGLPGGSLDRKNKTSIIDAFYDKETKTFYAIDILAYSSQDFMNCDCEFRFQWLRTKIQEDELNLQKMKQSKIMPLEYASFTNPMAIDELIGTYPMWIEHPALDGLLFYHKESHYVSGTTPLVLWLFPFMVPEVLGIYSVNPTYIEQKPNNYTNYKDYIEEFNNKRKRMEIKRQERLKIRKRFNKRQMKMEVNEEDETNDNNESMDAENDEKEKIDQEMFLLETESNE